MTIIIDYNYTFSKEMILISLFNNNKLHLCEQILK